MRAEAGVDERVLLRFRFEDGDLRGGCDRAGRASPTDATNPSRQNAGFSGPRTAAASQTRPSRSSIELWLLARVSQIASSPQYGDAASGLSAAACPGPRLSGICGSRTGILNVVALFSTGSRIGMRSELYSGDPNSGPLPLTVGIAPIARDQVVQVLLLVHPVAQRDDDVALGALGAARAAVRQLALRDAIGPVAVVLE